MPERKAVTVMLVSLAMVVLLASTASARIVASANGSGHVTIEGENRTFAFTALEDDSGVDRGQAQLQARQEDNKIHLDIDCLVVTGNTARVSGIVTRSDDPVLMGWTGIFRVIDGGAGRNSPPDQISLVHLFPPLFNQSCRTYEPSPLHPVERGNIQVHK